MAVIRMCVLLMVVANGGAAAQDNGAGAITRGLGATLVLYSDDPGAEFLGSGFVYGDGTVGLTNAHVLGTAASVVVAYRDGTRSKVPVIARDAGRDIAVLQLNRAMPGLIPTPGTQQIGTAVIALGAPLGAGFTATRGIVAAEPRQVDAAVPLRLVQHDAAINPGSSGGPLIDMQGRLVGMNSQIANGSRLFVGISYAISADDLMRLVTRMLAGSQPPVPYLGLDVRPVNAVIAAGLGVKRTGLLVDHVQPGSSAERAGVYPGDILLTARGHEIARPGDLAFRLDGGARQVTLKVWRAGQTRDIWMDLTTKDMSAPPVPTDESGQILIGFQADETGRVASIDPDGRAANAGLLLGDQILLANGRTIAPLHLDAADEPKPLVLLVKRDNRSLHVVIDPSFGSQPHHPIGGNRLDLEVERF